MNTTIIHRMKHDKLNYYTKISRKLLQDKRLSVIAIGLMCMILSNNDKYIINVANLKISSKLTRKQFYDAWNKLQELQYVIQSRTGKNTYNFIINEKACSWDAPDGMSPSAQ